MRKMAESIKREISSFISYIDKSENGIDPFSAKYSKHITAKHLNLGKSAENNELLVENKLREINNTLHTLDTDYVENDNRLGSKKRKYAELDEMTQI